MHQNLIETLTRDIIRRHPRLSWLIFSLLALFTLSTVFAIFHKKALPAGFESFGTVQWQSQISIEFGLSILIASILARFFYLGMQYTIKVPAYSRAFLGKYFAKKNLQKFIFRCSKISRFLRKRETAVIFFLSILVLSRSYLRGLEQFIFILLSVAILVLTLVVSKAALFRNYSGRDLFFRGLPDGASRDRKIQYWLTALSLAAAICVGALGVISMNYKLSRTDKSIAISSTRDVVFSGNLVLIDDKGALVCEPDSLDVFILSARHSGNGCSYFTWQDIKQINGGV